MKNNKIKILSLFAIIIAILIGSSLYLLLPKVEKTNHPLSKKEEVSKTNKKVVADITKTQIGLYEENVLKKFFPINKEDRPLIYLNSGEYPQKYLSSLNLNQSIVDFSDESTGFFVLNSEDEKHTGLDKESLYFLKNSNASFPKVSASTILVADINNGAIIYEKEKSKSLPIASLSKLMTAVITMEEMEQNKYVTITKEMLSAGYGSYGNLRRGEQLKVSELLYPLLLSSSNDAAFVLAMDYGKEGFAKKMNNKASFLKMINTFYEEPSGISPNNVSSAEDLFNLSQYIYQNKKWIFDLTSLKSVNSWRNSNYFAGSKGYLGGKSGYTEEAKETTVNIFSLPLSSPENREIAFILLQSNDRERDVLTILKWIKKNVAYRGDIKPKKEFSKEETMSFARDLETISLSFVGNIAIGADTKKIALTNGGDFSFLFKGLDSLKDVDITFGNLEGPVSDTGIPLNKKQGQRMHPLFIKSLREAGFDALSVANKSTGDWGEIAFKDTIARLKNEKIAPIGGGKSIEEATVPLIIKRKKIKVGFLSFSDDGPSWLKAGIEKAGILLVDDLYAKRIKNAVSKTNILVTAVSFGETNKERQTELAHTAIDNGAKIFIGYGQGNPNQTVEKYKDGIIMYNLGDFLTDETVSNLKNGNILEVYISGNGNIKKVDIKKQVRG